MINKPLGVSRRPLQAAIALLLVAMPLLVAQNAAAQPGDRRSPQQIRKDLEAELAEVETLLAEEPDRHYLYESRGQALTDLYKYSSDRTERESFAERAFADFDTYQLLTKRVPLLARAELHKLIWLNEFPDPRRTDPGAPTLDTVRRSSHFDGAVAAFLENIRQLHLSHGYDARDERLRDLYARVSNLYLMRAQVFAKAPEAVQVTDLRQQAWDDFEQAAKYRKKSVYPPTLLHATEVYIAKAEAAFTLGEYDIALEAYQATDDFMEDNWKPYCEHHGADNCESLRRSYLDRVSLLRARTYLKQGNYEKVISNLDDYLSQRPPSASICPGHYRMRAEANRKLGNLQLAQVDEKKASQANGTSCN